MNIQGISKYLPALLFISVVFFVIYAGAEQESDKEAREEARRTILIPFSKDAGTSALKLSEDCVKMVNLWLDFGRNKYAGRAKPSRRFQGVAHPELKVADNKITFRASFTSLCIDSASIPVCELPVIIGLLNMDKYLEKVKVPGDTDEYLTLWTVMLATDLMRVANPYLQSKEYAVFVKNGGKPLNADLLAKQAELLTKQLIDGFFVLPPTPERAPRTGLMGSQRGVWLKAIAALGGEKAGARLKKILAGLLKEGNKADIRNAGIALAGTNGREAEEYILGGLKSEDVAYMLTVLSCIPPHCSEKVVQAVIPLLDSDNKRLVDGALWALMRIAGSDSSNRAMAVNVLVKKFKSMEGGQRYRIAMGLVRNGCKDETVINYLKELLAKLKADKPNDFKIQFIEQALKDIEKK